MTDLKYSQNLAVRPRAGGPFALSEPGTYSKPVLALMRLLRAAVLLLPIYCAHAGVVFTNVYSFTGTNDSANPVSTLVQGNDSNFYGTTAYGGTNGFGTVFKMSTNGTLTSLYSFTDGYDGANPGVALAQDSGGCLYGTTSATVWTYGTMFKITTTGSLTTLHTFTASGDGELGPNGLVLGSDGDLYGTMKGYPRGLNLGTVFRSSTNGSGMAWGHSFRLSGFGANPEAALVQGTDGNFYGTTANGGTNGFGTVYKMSADGAFTSMYSFAGGNDGSSPQAALVQGSDAYLYGTTGGGGVAPNWGTVFKMSTNGVLTTLYAFTNSAGPWAGLVQGSDGYLYGMTWGSVFRISTDATLTILHSFTGGNVNAFSNAGLVQGSDGSFYGATSAGGTYGNGTIFRLTIVPDPQLTITPSGANVILTWPTNFTGFTLQSATNLASPAAWTTNSPTPVVVNGQNIVTNPMSGSQQFFRLSQ